MGIANLHIGCFQRELIIYFVGIDNARFKRPVEPGDQVHLQVKVQRRKRDMWKFSAEALVDDQVVCSADLMCAKSKVA